MPEQPQRTELSEIRKGQILALSAIYSGREIGRQLGISHSTVSAFLSRYADRENYDNFHHIGRPRKTASSGDRYIVRSAETNTSQQLTQSTVDTNTALQEQ